MHAVEKKAQEKLQKQREKAERQKQRQQQAAAAAAAAVPGPVGPVKKVKVKALRVKRGMKVRVSRVAMSRCFLLRSIASCLLPCLMCWGWRR